MIHARDDYNDTTSDGALVRIPADEPEDWRDRLFKEKAELEEKIRKLEAFLARGDRVAIDDRAHHLLKRYYVMVRYFDILSLHLGDDNRSVAEGTDA